MIRAIRRWALCAAVFGATATSCERTVLSDKDCARRVRIERGIEQ